MAATILVRDVLYRICSAVNDLDPQFVTYPERELVNYLNDGQMIVSTFIPSMCSRVLSIKLKPGTMQSIDAIAAADCKLENGAAPSGTIYGKQFLRPVCNMGADGATPGLSIHVGDMKMMDKQTPGWHGQTGQIRQVFWDPLSPRTFWVSKGAGSSDWIRIVAQVRPDLVPNTAPAGSEAYKWDGTNATTISIDDECLDPLVNYCIARAYLRQNEGADRSMAAPFAELFTSWINAKVTALTGANPNLKRFPMSPTPVGAAS